MKRIIQKTRWLVVSALFAAVQAQAVPVQWAGNGHWYDLISASGVDWYVADATANASTYLGLPGHLATVTSAAEDAFVLALVAGPYNQYYVGGIQNPITETVANANWSWVTGEPWSYTNWSGGEPNDAYDDANNQASEQWLGIAWGGAWNDERNLGNISGYIVEYEPSLPDGGSSLLLFSLALLGVGTIRRKSS